MAKKKLSEAAAEILGGNVASKMKSGEPFGAGKDASGVKTPEQSGKAEDMVGPEVSATDSGVAAATAAAPKATPPGATPPVGAEPMKDIKKGEPEKDRAKAHETGVVEEKDEDHGHEDDKDEDDEDKDDEDEDEKNEEIDLTKPSDRQHAITAWKAWQRQPQKFDKKKQDAKDMKEENMESPSISEKVMSYVRGKTGVKVEEDISAIFAGESLSESFMKKARMVYEAAVISTATNIAEDIENEYAETLEQVTEKIRTELTEQVDDYLNYMVEEWVKENEIAIEKGLRAELTEDFISGLRNLFVEHYIDIPEDKVNVVEELAEKVEALESKLNEEINRNVALKKNLNEAKKIQILSKVCEGLTETQVEKIKSLAEGVEFASEEDYSEALETLRENYFPSKAVKTTVLDEEAVDGEKTGLEETKTVNPEMEQYVKAIRKTLK